MALTVVIVSVLLLISSISASPAFEAAFPQWPEQCCKLELEKHIFGNVLPDDVIFGGSVNGKRWGYMVDRNENYEVVGITEQFDELPVRLAQTEKCSNYTSKCEYEILTNPNKCAIDWYTTRYAGEKFFNSSGVSMRSDQIFVPAYNGFYFATRNVTDGDIPEGADPANVKAGQQWPAVLYKGAWNTCSRTGSQRTGNKAGTKVMYVDCVKSLVTMSKSELVNITANDQDVDNIRDTETVYFKRTFVNKSNLTQKQSISFSAEKTNSMYVSVSNSYSSSKCEEQRSSFSESFGTTVSSEVGVGLSFWFFSFSAKIGIDVSSGFQKMTEQASMACGVQKNTSSSASTHKEVAKYSFSDEITIPANSMTTVTATSNPYRGRIPYTLTYELTPPANMVNALELGLEFYKFGDRRETTDRGTVLVQFDGVMVVDSGYEIVVDLTAVPVDDPESGVIMNSKQIVYPSS